MSQEFKQGDQVQVHSTKSPLDGRIGMVCGVSSVGIVYIWIIQFPSLISQEHPFMCASIPAAV